MAGNLWDWTVEADPTFYHILRGCCSFTNVSVWSAGIREKVSSIDPSNDFTSRLSLYIQSSNNII